MSEFHRFGSSDLFEIAFRWSKDEEERDVLPLTGGWSMGDLKITVGRQTLTARRFGDSHRDCISWYVYPLLEWFIQNWTWIFHEESYSWDEKAGMPAAPASVAALGQYIGSSDNDERASYRDIHGWWKRHALRAADSSALYPDICFRRVEDDVEISWSARQPQFAPEEMSLVLAPGFATLSIDAVAKPVWDFLAWSLKTAPVVTHHDRKDLDELSRRFQQLKRTPLKELESKYLNDRLNKLLLAAAKEVDWENESAGLASIPAIASLDVAVLMFGGLTPSIGDRDAVQLLKFLKRYQSQSETEELLRLVEERPFNPSLAPYQAGYELAEDVRDELDISPTQPEVNIKALLRKLGISVEEKKLETDSIRGVAVAGANFKSAILVNTTSPFNKTVEGRKFTMAHELCHILFDRTRARKLSHVSGTWTTAPVEKRANAFAAMFLASRYAVKRTFKGATVEAIAKQARVLGLGYSSLVEHLYNLGLIDEADRQKLRMSEPAAMLK
jgi:Zn-dependent peptidase ImmA (M78 family)